MKEKKTEKDLPHYFSTITFFYSSLMGEIFYLKIINNRK